MGFFAAFFFLDFATTFLVALALVAAFFAAGFCAAFFRLVLFTLAPSLTVRSSVVLLQNSHPSPRNTLSFLYDSEGQSQTGSLHPAVPLLSYALIQLTYACTVCKLRRVNGIVNLFHGHTRSRRFAETRSPQLETGRPVVAFDRNTAPCRCSGRSSWRCMGLSPSQFHSHRAVGERYAVCCLYQANLLHI